MKNNPAGWYRNLRDRRQHGYWDGEAWVDPHDLAPTSDAPGIDSEDSAEVGDGTEPP
jgi:hypothetical protein